MQLPKGIRLNFVVHYIYVHIICPTFYREPAPAVYPSVATKAPGPRRKLGKGRIEKHIRIHACLARNHIPLNKAGPLGRNRRGRHGVGKLGAHVVRWTCRMKIASGRREDRTLKDFKSGVPAAATRSREVKGPRGVHGLDRLIYIINRSRLSVIRLGVNIHGLSPSSKKL